MKTRLIAPLVSALFCIVVLTACPGKKPTPVSERIAKIWTASSVAYDGTTVYNRTTTTNVVPGYSNFKLDLSSGSTVRYTEFDGNTFTGTWSVSSDGTQLILAGLTPQPTGTNGTITFTITSLSDSALSLTRTTTSQKTGGTTNTYTLSNP